MLLQYFRTVKLDYKGSVMYAEHLLAQSNFQTETCIKIRYVTPIPKINVKKRNILYGACLFLKLKKMKCVLSIRLFYVNIVIA